MRKIVISYGLTAAAISAVMWTGLALLMKNSVDYGSSMWVGYAAMLLSTFIIYFAMTNYRDNVNGGEIKFLKAALIGFYISLIYAVLYVVSWTIISSILLPDYMDNYIANEIANIQNSNLPAAEMSEKLAEMENYKTMFKNPWTVAAFVFMEPWPVAIIVTLVSALIVSLKKKKQEVVIA